MDHARTDFNIGKGRYCAEGIDPQALFCNGSVRELYLEHIKVEGVALQQVGRKAYIVFIARLIFGNQGLDIGVPFIISANTVHGGGYVHLAKGDA